MLEYLLIRQRDAPILRQSQGTLDYIVLDEAHSYMGAKAAEIALLLRRVALAFGRTPDPLRYVATSATVGGEDRKRGVEGKRVSVRVDLGGRRIVKKKNKEQNKH